MLTKKIFIIEDDPLFSLMLNEYLNKFEIQRDYINFEIHSFYSLKEAKYELSKSPDIIFLDYIIENDEAEKQTGLPLVDFLSDISVLNRITLIVVSGNATDTDVQALRKRGVRYIVNKDKNTFRKLEHILNDEI